jgi:hypothetical protein
MEVRVWRLKVGNWVSNPLMESTMIPASGGVVNLHFCILKRSLIDLPQG